MFYSQEQLQKFNFKSFGKNVLISDRASIYNSSNIEIGDNVRIDDFCILSPGSSLKFGSYIHVACYASIIGAGSVVFEDYTCISGRVSIYTSNDDYSGNTMTNSMVPDRCKNVTHGPVVLKKHVLVGAGSIILPNVTIEEGTSVHALSVVNRNCEPYSVYAGAPAKKIRERKRDFLNYESLIQVENFSE